MSEDRQDDEHVANHRHYDAWRHQDDVSNLFFERYRVVVIVFGGIREISNENSNPKFRRHLLKYFKRKKPLVSDYNKSPFTEAALYSTLILLQVKSSQTYLHSITQIILFFHLKGFFEDESYRINRGFKPVQTQFVISFKFLNHQSSFFVFMIPSFFLSFIWSYERLEIYLYWHILYPLALIDMTRPRQYNQFVTPAVRNIILLLCSENSKRKMLSRVMRFLY